MKKLLFILLAYSLPFLTNAQDANQLRYTELKSSIITKTITTVGLGSNQLEEITEYSDEYGQLKAVYKKTYNTKNGKKELTADNLSIVNKNDGYEIDLKEKSGVKMDVSMYKMFGMFITSELEAKYRDNPTTLKQFVEQNNGKWYGQEVVLGRACDVFELLGVKAWNYKGINLKTESNQMGVKIVEVVSKLEENVTISADKFKVPAGIAIEDMKAMMAPEDEESPEDNIPVGLPYSKFETMANNFNIDGYSRVMLSQSDGQYMTAFIQPPFNNINISAISMINIADVSKSSDIEMKKEKDIVINGHSGVYCTSAMELEEAEGSKTGYLVLQYPEYKMSLFITMAPLKSYEDFERIAKMVKF